MICGIDGCEARPWWWVVLGERRLSVCEKCRDELLGFYGWRLALT